MPAEDHPSYSEEKQRLDYTLNYVEQSLVSTSSKKTVVDKDVQRARRAYKNESSQEYIDMLVNAAIQPGLELKLRNLEAARSKPYFARMDFRENGKERPEKLYLGKMCLSRDADQRLIIIDWRAPVANLYYEGRLGPAGYSCPEGEIGGDLLLKRQFSIDQGQLQEIFDIDITTNDEILQSSLGANADNRLKDIVATIQSEQNRIIRAEMNTPLLVQGVAGSGKTTIALHRIAYLVYNFDKSFRPENFMIIAPNRLFLNYISEVLPELGVERVKQTTFEEFAMELIGERFKMIDPFQKLLGFIDPKADSDKSAVNERIKQAAAVKSSLIFQTIMERYVRFIEATLLPEEDFKVGDWLIYSYQEIRELFYRDYRDWPILKRLKELEKHFRKRIKDRKESVIERLQQRCDRMVWNYKMNLPEGDRRQDLIIKAIDQKNERVREIEHFTKEGIKEYLKKIPQLKPSQYYHNLILDPEFFREFTTGLPQSELLEFIRSHTAGLLNAGKMEIEDLAPLIYLKHSFYGLDERIPVKHIVIDEAQDFSVFQFYVLKRIIKDSSFTILGDLSQGIHSYRGLRDWRELRDAVFDTGSVFQTLEQSYRTTVEIMEAANRVISRINDGRLVIAKPVIRHGPPVEINRQDSLHKLAASLGERIRLVRREGFRSVAVICKTLDECKAFHHRLKEEPEPPALITGKEAEYNSGIVMVPSYLAKGLEFDVVLIANASSGNYQVNELDAKLLYVAMTRPLHRLYIYYQGELSPLLSQ